MTEVRTTSSTGGEKGVKPERYDLLPKEALDAIARVYAFGATKYADHNWRKRYEWSKSYAAAMRHMTAFWAGETHDPESGLPHPAHAGFHIFAMLTWLAEDGIGSEFDDRYVPDGESLGPDPNFAEVAEQILADSPPSQPGTSQLSVHHLFVETESEGDVPPGVVKDLSEDEDVVDLDAIVGAAADLLETRKRKPTTPVDG